MKLALLRFINLLMAAACLAFPSPAQQPTAQVPANDCTSAVPAAIARLHDPNDIAPVDLETMARCHVTTSVPLLRRLFDKPGEPKDDLYPGFTKAKVANVLLRLGVKDGPYWDFLSEHAHRVLTDPPPTPFAYDENGAAIKTAPSARFVIWANNHKMSLEDAFQYATYEMMATIVFIGSADDPRAIPILKQALALDNILIQAQAAMGLAELNVTDAVPDIVRACAEAPRSEAGTIARSLVYFDTPAAQSAVDKYLEPSAAHALRMSRAQGQTPFN